MTDEELKELVASLAIDRKETERRMRETDRQMKETSQQIKATERLVKELSKNIGGLNNKFGSFTEAMAFPSMILALMGCPGLRLAPAHAGAITGRSRWRASRAPPRP